MSSWQSVAPLPGGRLNLCLAAAPNGLLYVAGGYARLELNTLYSFNEATGLWDDLPPMLHACEGAASGVIGNELFIAGGYHDPDDSGNPATLQIYDIPSRRWRLGAALPEPRMWTIGVVADGKFFVIDRFPSRDLLVYDSQSETWTQEAAVTNSYTVRSACAHKGRLVVFLSNGTACERANDGSWSPYEVAEARVAHVAESVILG